MSKRQDEVLFLNVSDIRENPVALRTVNLEDERYIGLRDSIAAVGINSSISVRRKVEEVDGKQIECFELLDGLHRFTAAKQCGLTTIPAIVKSISDSQTLEVQAMANLHVVSTAPAEYARQLQRIFAANPTLTISQMAAKVCKSTAWVAGRLNLLKLTEEIQKVVDDGRIPVSNAVALSKLPAEEQVNYVEQAAAMPSDEFVPLAQARAKEIRDAKRQGRDTKPKEYTPLPRCQKMSALKDELDTGKIGPDLCKKHGAKRGAEGFALGVAWVLSMDPTSVEVRTAAENDKRKKLEDAKAARAAERAKKKAEKAQADALAAQEAVSK